MLAPAYISVHSTVGVYYDITILYGLIHDFLAIASEESITAKPIFALTEHRFWTAAVGCRLYRTCLAFVQQFTFSKGWLGLDNGKHTEKDSDLDIISCATDFTATVSLQ